MRIYFGTNRNPNDQKNPTDFGNSFSSSGLTDLRFGWADVSGENLDQYTLTVADEVLDVGSENASVNNFSRQTLGSKVVFEEIRREMKQTKQDCVISIHGFNYTFQEAIQRTAQIKRFYNELPMVYFLFTWPSDGSMLPFKAYASDRDDARASGVALGRGLLKFADFLREVKPEDYCQKNIHLFAHSMGNYALRWALQGIKSSSGSQLRRLLEQIILFAADEDDDAFEYDYKFQTLPDLGRRVTVYHNPGDKALVVSDFTKGNPDRLGAGGPRNSRALPDKVSVVNCESVVRFKDDPTGHQYYRIDKTVRQDVISVLKGINSQDITTRKYQQETRSFKLKAAKA
ncbi:MAG: alpha/beta hydrolase [Gammaproteobacteria bacterium]|nr:alpha/beta hydrolase [Gammaproteobacteria bacterium]